MNTAKQFWTLFKYQSAINPFLWLMPLIFGLPLFLHGLFTRSVAGGYHPSFFSLATNQNLFFVGILGVLVLAPEKFQFSASSVAANSFGNEFILTRAIDRRVLYRAKAAVFYLLILSVPMLNLSSSLKTPDVIVAEYSKSVQQECLRAVPGSTLLPDAGKSAPSLLSIPRGNVLVAEWQLWVLLLTALLLQLFILLLYPFRYARITLWTVYFGFIFVPLFTDLHSIAKNTLSFNERLLFFFTAHQTLVWILTGAGFLLCQLWCEQRFARLEQ